MSRAFDGSGWSDHTASIGLRLTGTNSDRSDLWRRCPSGVLDGEFQCHRRRRTALATTGELQTDRETVGVVYDLEQGHVPTV